jgi:putative transcriptional regulator
MALMERKLFNQLVESMRQMDEIVLGKRKPSRVFMYSPMEVRKIRQSTGLSQVKFAEVIEVGVGTLRNWEQGRRDPTGPAKALLKVIKNDPKRTIETLAGAR